MLSKALVVDDDRIFSEALKESLEKRSFKVWTANDHEEAMRSFRENAPQLVVLDYRMPLRDGLSLLREMQPLNPNTVYIILTGFGSIPLAVEAMKEGAQSFMTKPCDTDELLKEANRLWEQNRKKFGGLSKSEMLSYNLGVLEKQGIEKALEATKGNVSKAAVLLGIDRRTLQRKMKSMFAFGLVACAGLLFATSGFLPTAAHAEQKSSPSYKAKTTKFMALKGEDEFRNAGNVWDDTYSRKGYVFGKEPSKFLRQNIDKLPKGKALDIAMGEGRNTVFLARKGFWAEGVDISNVGIRKAHTLAAENGVQIHTVNADLNKYKIKPNEYAVIANFYYLQRSLFPQIKNGLQPGGVVIFETYTEDHLNTPAGANLDKRFTLKKGELRQVFDDFEILHYSERNNGKEAVASIIARKPLAE